jgi:hypothetical protein
MFPLCFGFSTQYEPLQLVRVQVKGIQQRRLLLLLLLSAALHDHPTDLLMHEHIHENLHESSHLSKRERLERKP